MSHGNLVSLGRYLVFAIAGALLAPYAGCHIFTSAPSPVASDEMADVMRKDSKGRETSSDYTDEHDPVADFANDSPTSRNLTDPKLSEIENLLRER